MTGTQNTGYCNGDTKVACRLLLKRKEKLIILARLITQIEEIATSSKKLYFAELMYRGLYRGSKFDFSASSAIRLEQIMNIQKMWRRAAPVSFVLFSFSFFEFIAILQRKENLHCLTVFHLQRLRACDIPVGNDFCHVR